MSNESEKKILEITTAIACLRAEKHDKHDSLTNKEEIAITDKIKDMNKALVSAITDGANACDCGTSPHGMVQYVAVKKVTMPYFEIGCLACVDKRAQGMSRESAVSNWNDKTYVK